MYIFSTYRETQIWLFHKKDQRSTRENSWNRLYQPRVPNYSYQDSGFFVSRFWFDFLIIIASRGNLVEIRPEVSFENDYCVFRRRTVERLSLLKTSRILSAQLSKIMINNNKKKNTKTPSFQLSRNLAERRGIFDYTRTASIHFTRSAAVWWD